MQIVFQVEDLWRSIKLQPNKYNHIRGLLELMQLRGKLLGFKLQVNAENDYAMCRLDFDPKQPKSHTIHLDGRK